MDFFADYVYMHESTKNVLQSILGVLIAQKIRFKYFLILKLLGNAKQLIFIWHLFIIAFDKFLSHKTTCPL